MNITTTTSAIKQRINRKLRHQDERLKTSRSHGERSNLGDYYIVDFRNIVTASHCNLTELARDLGVLAHGETIAL